MQACCRKIYGRSLSSEGFLSPEIGDEAKVFLAVPATFELVS